MKTSLRFLILALTWLAAVRPGTAQQAKVSQATSGVPGAIAGEKPAAPSAPIGKALVYVYRKGHIAGGSTLIFANGDFLAELHNANFASVEVPQGAVSIASIAAVNILFHFPPAAHWASGPGCTNVNWRRLFEVSSAAAEPCDNELRDWIRKCSEEFGPLRRACALEIGPMEEARSLLRLAVEPEAPPLSYFRNVHDSRERLTRVKADMQAAKTYYFRWSIPYAPFQAAKAPQLELVDDATGAKEVSRLRRAER
jgi:hypothetical protein